MARCDRRRFAGFGLHFVVQFIGKCRTQECSNPHSSSPVSRKTIALPPIRGVQRPCNFGSIEGRRVVCGKVSARDGSGKIAGPQRLITNGAELTVLQEQASSERFNAAWLKICT